MGEARGKRGASRRICFEMSKNFGLFPLNRPGGLGKILSSASVERLRANEKDMKHDVYFLHVRS